MFLYASHADAFPLRSRDVIEESSTYISRLFLDGLVRLPHIPYMNHEKVTNRIWINNLWWGAYQCVITKISLMMIQAILLGKSKKKESGGHLHDGHFVRMHLYAAV